jgi:hypothetical protein
VELKTSADFFLKSWEKLLGGMSDPMKFRFILQPASAAFFAIRAGLKDAREGRPPYLWACLTDSCHRREILRRGWRDDLAAARYDCQGRQTVGAHDTGSGSERSSRSPVGSSAGPCQANATKQSTVQLPSRC